MSIIAVGMDLVRVERIAAVQSRRGAAFTRRIFTSREQGDCEHGREAALHYAGRFAAKEAVMKVLGTGWGQGVTWLDIEIRNEMSGAPTASLSGVAARHATERGIANIHISITHDGGMAAAVAIGEA